MKKFLLFILIALTLSPPALAGDKISHWDDGYKSLCYYELISEESNDVKLVYSDDYKNYHDINIPAEFTELGKNYVVKSIDVAAFKNCNILESITLPETLTEISDEAFMNCTSLKKIAIPYKVTKIGVRAFCNNTSLYRVDFPNNCLLASIGVQAFQNTNIKDFIIPVHVTSIGDQAFDNCANLRAVSWIPPTSKLANITIGNNLFGAAPSADPSSDPSADTPAFQRLYIFADKTPDLESSLVPQIGRDNYEFRPFSIYEYGGYSNKYDVTFLGLNDVNAEVPDVVIPPAIYHRDNNTYIVEVIASAGGLNNNVKTVDVPNTVRALAENSFKDCKGLATVIFPEDLLNIGANSFAGCDKLASINIPAGCESIREGAFSGCSSLTLILIPEKLKLINEYVFDGCSSLTSITIPEGAASVGRYAFNGCASLTSIDIPENVTSIGDNAFSGCTSLTDFKFAKNSKLETVGNHILKNCSSLESISLENLPDATVESLITGGAFSGCSSLVTVSINSENSKYCGVTRYFNGIDYTVLYSKDTTTLAFCAPAIPDLPYDEKVTKIGTRALSGCKNIKGIILYPQVNVVSSGAFEYCTALDSIILTDSGCLIDYHVFRGCENLKKIVCVGDTPNYIESTNNQYIQNNNITVFMPLGSYAYYCKTKGWWTGCKLQPLAMSTEKFIDGEVQYEFYDHTGLIGTPMPIKTDWKYPPKSYHALPFDCNSLNVKLIGHTKDFNKSSLTFDGKFEHFGLTFNLTHISDNAFKDCSRLVNVSIPESVKSIGHSAFENCSNLKSVKLPSSIENAFAFGGSVFKNCTSLVDVNIPSNLMIIWDDTFRGCTSLSSVSLPEYMDEIGFYAFEGCSDLTSITIPDISWIDEGAFKNCTSLKTVKFLGENPPAMLTDVFSETVEGEETPARLSSLKYIAVPDVAAYTTGIENFLNELGDIDDLDEDSDEYYDYLCFSEWLKYKDLIVYPISDIKLDHSSAELIEGETFKLTASVTLEYIPDESVTDETPAEKVDWSSGDASVASVDADGNVTVHKLGEVDITAYSLANNITKTCTFSIFPLGDADKSNNIDVNDVVATANHIVGNITDETKIAFIKRAADMNGNGSITVTDAWLIAEKASTWNLGGSGSSPSNMPKRSNQPNRTNKANNPTSAQLLATASPTSLQLSLSSTGYTALQADILLPDGVEVSKALLRDGATDAHILMTATKDNLYRLMIFSMSNDEFTTESPIVELQLQGNSTEAPQILNALASDTNANPVELDIQMSSSTSGIPEVGENSEIEIKSVKGGIAVNGAQGKTIHIFTPDGKLLKTQKSLSNSEQIPLAPSLYIVRVADRSAAIVVR